MMQFLGRKRLRIIGFLAILTALLLPLGAAAGGRVDDNAGGKSHCAPGEKIWFNAAMEDTGQRVSLCGAATADGAVAWIQFRMGVPGKPDIVWPEQRRGSAKAFTYRRYTRYRVTLLKLGFNIGDRDYAILESDLPGQTPPYLLQLRIRRTADGTVLASHPLKPVSAPLGIMRLEYRVPTKSYNE